LPNRLKYIAPARLKYRFGETENLLPNIAQRDQHLKGNITNTSFDDETE